MNNYLNSDQPAVKGLPTVSHIAGMLHITPKYLSSVLRLHTSQHAQHYIHEQLVGKAKEQLSTTTLSVSETAYQLGFEHSQSFSRFFKIKTNITPLAFRASFNG